MEREERSFGEKRDTSVRVAVRIRPFLNLETAEGVEDSVSLSGVNSSKIPSPML